MFSYGMNYEKRALRKKYKDKRNWREYNEKLVARGEAYISLIAIMKRLSSSLARGMP